MASSVIISDQVEVPLEINSLAKFRRWATSKTFPDQGRIDYVANHIEVDMSPENLFSHGSLKVEIARVFANRVKRNDSGHVFSDRTRISCPTAGLSAEPDVVYLSHQSLDNRVARLLPKADGGNGDFVEIEGPPDIVVEIVSDGSVKKDTVRLPAAYYESGVAEFWLVDARGKDLLFQIHDRGNAAYEKVAVAATGFQHSNVFGCQFQLQRTRHTRGHWVYDLLEQDVP